MKTKIKKTKEMYEVVCDEGVLKYETLQQAENKVRCIVKSEGFGYVKKTIFDENGKVLDEIYCG